MRPVLLCLLLVFAIASTHQTIRKKKGSVSALNKLKAQAKSGLLTNAMAFSRMHQHLQKFEGHEHRTSSSAININLGVDNDHWVTTDEFALKTHDNVYVSYSEITGIAGDYFGVKDSPTAIVAPDEAAPKSMTRDTKGTLTRFKKAFADLWQNPTYGGDASLKNKKDWKGRMGDLLRQLRIMLDDEKYYVSISRTSRSPSYGSDAYEGPLKGDAVIGMIKDIGSNYNYFSAEGKGSSEGNWRALAYNDDHFSWAADWTYWVGHVLAREWAHKAGQLMRDVATKNPSKEDKKKWKAQARALLNDAYGVDAFISHFLTDRFSAGHTRTPRMELRNACPAITDSYASAGITANVQHDEDNINCLLVKNRQGYTWWACGDHKFFDDENCMNRFMLNQAVKASVASVRGAFEDGKKGIPLAPMHKAHAGLGWVPYVAGQVSDVKFSLAETFENTCPMFRVVSNGKVLSFPDPQKSFPKDQTGRKVLKRIDSSLTANPRSAYALSKTDVGNSIAQYLGNPECRKVMPSQFIPLTIKNGITADDVKKSSLQLDCQYEEVQPNNGDHCCNVLHGRATPKVSDANNLSRKTYTNACAGASSSGIGKHTVTALNWIAGGITNVYSWWNGK